MATKLPSVDVVFVGMGWTGGIIAKELAPTKLKMVALERGRPRATNPDFIEANRWDELRFASRYDLLFNALSLHVNGSIRFHGRSSILCGVNTKIFHHG